MHAAVVSQPGAAEVFGSLAQPDPWILFVLANVFLDHDRDEKFHRFEAHAIHLRGDRQHRPGSHSQRPETLLPIAECRIDEMNFAHTKSWSVGVMDDQSGSIEYSVTPALHYSVYFFALSLCQLL